jgi:hypothetical protein
LCFHTAFIGALVSAIALALIVALTVTGFTIAIIFTKRNKKGSKTILSKTQLARKYKLTVRHSGASNSEPTAAEDLDTTENFDYEPEPISHMAAAAAAAINAGHGLGEDDIEIDYEPVVVPLDTNTNISYALHTR